MTKGIYIHIPFCVSKCNYCSFFSIEVDKDSILPEKYIPAVCKEIDLKTAKSDAAVKSIYIGGGTPGIIDPELIAMLLEKCFAGLDIASDYECTIEVNPGTVTPDKVKAYRAAGVNRVSVGGQSFNDKFLQFLGRKHKASDIVKAVDVCQKNGLDNISLDLMFGYSGQTVADWENDMHKALALDLKHISLYDLSVEEGSRFFEEDQESGLVLEDNVYLEMYSKAVEVIGSKYLHYEISNFAISEEYVSLHNMLYWGNLSYIGVGAGAFSYEKEVRSSNITDVSHYIKLLEREESVISEQEKLLPTKRLKETFVLNLRRLRQGASLIEAEEFCNSSFSEDFRIKLQGLVQDGLLSSKKDTFFLTSRGIALFNQVAVTLI